MASWDDGKHKSVRRVQISYSDSAINSIRVDYDSNGNLFSAPQRGGTGNQSAEFSLSFPEEYLTEMTGYYSDTISGEVITGLTFKTNRRTLGLYGTKTRTYFSINLPKDNHVIGFHGKSGNVLNALEVHYGPIPAGGTGASSGQDGTGGTPETGGAGGDPGTGGTGGASGAGTGGTAGTGGAEGTPGTGGTGGTAGSGGSGGAPDGLFGGNGGLDWDDSDEYSGIRKIEIGYDNTGIHSITVGYDDTGSLIQQQRRGGTGGKTIPITFDFPNEYLIFVSGYYSKLSPTSSETVIKSLTFVTSNNQYGPYGEETGTAFEFLSPNESIVGFRGRSGAYLDAIGVHYGPIPNSTPSGTSGGDATGNIPGSGGSAGSGVAGGGGSAGSGEGGDISSGGLFGGNGGLDWDDSDEYSGVTRFVIAYDESVIHSITVTYDQTGSPMPHQRRGGTGGTIVPITFEFPNEYLIYVSGHYSNWSSTSPDVVIKSLTLITNRKQYGPYGEETGTPFELLTPNQSIIGFRGRSGAVLNAIGAHYGPIPESAAAAGTTATPGVPTTEMEPLVGPGPFGSPGGLGWDDGDQFSGVKRIDIGHDNSLIHSIAVTYDDTGSTIQAQRRGGDGGNRLPVEIKFPDEYLISVSGTYSDSSITSLTLETNKTKYGPYGQATGKSFVLKSPGKQIIGFCGTSGAYLNTLGAHFDEIPTSLSTPPSQTSNVPGVTSEASGGNGGNPWDDGVFDDVRKIYVGPGSDGIHSLRFDYDLNGQLVKGQEHGQTQIPPDEISLDYPKEYLTSVEGQSDDMPGYDGPVIQSVKFKTNLGREFGPFGYPTGNQFLFESKGGKIVGFHGRASNVIHKIGVHIKPGNA